MSKRLRIYMLSVFSLMLLLAGCSPVDTQMNKSANFGAYKTFSWMAPKENAENPKFKGELVDKNIRMSVENELATKGIMRNDQNPDFLIGYHTYTEEKQRVEPGYTTPMNPYYGGMFGGFYGYGGYYNNPYYGYYGYPGYVTPPRVYNYTEGTLVLDIVDAKSQELVWRGTIDGAVGDLGDLDEQIEKGVRAILKKYPAEEEDGDQSM